MSTSEVKAQRTCAFCGASGALTHEHVFPAWLEPYVPGDGDFTMFRAKTTDRAVLSEATWSTKDLDVRVGAICSACNHGWMSDLEDDVQPMIRPILLGGDAELSGDDRLKLARWICKSAIVMNAWKGRSAHTIDPSVVDAVREGRVPPHTQAWFGRCVPMAHHLHTDHTSADAWGESGDEFGITSSAFTVGPMAFHMLVATPLRDIHVPGVPHHEMVPVFPLNEQSDRPLIWSHLKPLSPDQVRALTPGIQPRPSLPI